jgi:pimeloyl-ACP methyl ester carboxylesterase
MLVSPPPLNAEPSTALARAWEAEEEALARGDLDAAVDAVLDAWLQPQAPRELRDRVAAMQRRTFELQHGAADLEEAPDPLETDRDALTRIAVPVLAVAGQADMPDFKIGVAEIAAALPAARTAILPGAGHLAPLETPDEFWSSLRGHLGTPRGDTPPPAR